MVLRCGGLFLHGGGAAGGEGAKETTDKHIVICFSEGSMKYPPLRK